MPLEWMERGNLTGPQGPPGQPGSDGAAGRGVQTTEINTGGHLIITYTDQTQVDLGDVTGEDGSGIAIAGSVATYADLPAGLGAANAGEGYLVEADGLLYIWSGTAFPAQGSGVAFQGPAGPQGVQGTPGADGKRGSQWTVTATDPSQVPGSALAGDLWLNTATGQVYQLADV